MRVPDGPWIVFWFHENPEVRYGHLEKTGQVHVVCTSGWLLYIQFLTIARCLQIFFVILSLVEEDAMYFDLISFQMGYSN